MKFRCFNCSLQIFNSIYCEDCASSINNIITEVYINDVEKYYYVFDYRKHYISIFDRNSHREILSIKEEITFKQLISYIENLVFI
jgi:hypothetical protein